MNNTEQLHIQKTCRHVSFKAFLHLSNLDPELQATKIESSLVVFTLSYFKELKVN